MPIKVKSKYKGARGKGSTNKRAIELGDVADVDDQNWVTLMGFAPSIKPYGAEPHNPPEMGTDNSPIPTEEDSQKPDQGNLSGGSDYDVSSEKEKPPHEEESVDHIKSNSEQKTTRRRRAKDSSQSNSQEVSGSKEGSLDSEEGVERTLNDYREKWTVANQIADIKIAAGQWKDNDRYQKVDHLSQHHSVEDLKGQLQDNQEMLGTIQASKETKNAKIPRGYSTSGQSMRSEDPLADILGDLGYEG